MATSWKIDATTRREFVQYQLGKTCVKFIAEAMGAKYEMTGLHQVASFGEVMYVVSLYIANGHMAWDGQAGSLALIVKKVMKDVEAGLFEQSAELAQTINAGYSTL